MQQESILHNRPNVPIRLEEYRSFFSAISIGLSRISFPWNQCSQRPSSIIYIEVSHLCEFFLKRRMAAYFSSFQMNLQRMPSRHETTYPHSSQIVYLRLWGYASPFTIYGAITGQVSFIFQRFPHSWKRQRGYAHWQGQGPVLFLQKEYGRFP